jgi:peptide/nickel transport system substrate-binding protein
MSRHLFRATLGAVALGAVALAGLPAPVQATTFTWATANDILGLDPHANNHGVTNAMKSNVYEPLVRRQADGSLAPRWPSGGRRPRPPPGASTCAATCASMAGSR